jgi:hypothetical protein
MTENIGLKIEAIDRLTVKEAGTVISDILSSGQDQSTIIVALETFSKIVGSHQQTNVTNCTIGVDCDKVLKAPVLDGEGNIDDRFDDINDIEETK